MIKKIQRKITNYIDFNKIDFSSIELDSTLPYNLYIKKDDNFLIVVEAGTLIDENVYGALQSQKAIYVYKKDKNKQKLCFESLELYILFAKNNPQYAIKLLYTISEKFFEKFLKSNNKFDKENVEAIVKSIILLIENNKNFVRDNMSDFKDDNILAHHSLQVAIYSINLGSLLGLRGMELLELGMAGYLHDIGIKLLSEEIVFKETVLSLPELEEMHKHCLYGVQLAIRNQIHSPYIIEAIKHHHENDDGTGYPDKKAAKDIGKFASIISVCDVFDALTSDRPYRKKMSSYKALTFMLNDSTMVKKFNDKYIKLFIKLLVSK